MTLAERVKLAAEALRKARATLLCMETGWDDDCGTASPFGGSDLYFEDDGDHVTAHAPVASALLDGFSVDEITEAGG